MIRLRATSLRRRWRRLSLWRRVPVVAAVVLVVLPVFLIALYRYLPPPVTPLMIVRVFQGEGIERDWVALEEISPNLQHAVIAAEDNNFCRHGGIDWQAINKAIESYEQGDRLRGASTISMQTARNLFLWPGRDWLRKGLEAYLTLLIEALWPKRRILEVYLNIIEWSGGVYGAEAASLAYFGKPAKSLGRREAALLATVLPNPRERSATKPNARQRHAATVIVRRIGQIRPLFDCL